MNDRSAVTAAGADRGRTAEPGPERVGVDDEGVGRPPGGPRTGAGARRHAALLWTGGLVAAVGMCAAVVVAVGSITRVPGSGLAALDIRVSWLLPAARLAADLAAAITVGCLVAAALVLPGRGTVRAPAYRWLRRTTWAAAVWAVAAALMLPGLLVEFLNTDLSQVSARAVLAFIRDTPYGAAPAAAVVLAGVVALGSRWVLTPAGARALLLPALLAVALPAAAEYAEAEGTPARVAVEASGMVLHVLGALVWAGALAALLLVRLTTADLVTAVRRYSRFAPALALTVAASGLLTAAGALQQPGQWLETDYGRVVVLKTLALAGLVALGWWHRRRTVPALAAGKVGVFRRIAAAELLVFAATFGLAAGLSRTPAPEPGSAVQDMSSAAYGAAARDDSPHGDGRRP